MNSRKCRSCGEPVEVCREKWRQREQVAAGERRVPASVEVLEAEVAGMLRRAMAQARLEREVTETLTRQAWHEAGHVVAAMEMGFPVDQVSIDFERGGRTHVRGSHGAEVALAGVLAERRFLGYDDAEGCESDERAALEAMQDGESADVAVVEDILARRSREVKAIAEALLEHERLSSGDVEAIVRLAGSPATRSAVDGEVRSAVVEAHVDGMWPGSIRRPGWIEYDPGHPPAGWDARAVELWNDLHWTSGDDPEFARLQYELSDYLDRLKGRTPADRGVPAERSDFGARVRAEERAAGGAVRTYGWTPAGQCGPDCGCDDAA